MDKPYDLKALGLKLQAKGAPVLAEAAEVAAEKTYEALKEWIAESAALSATPYDNIVVGFFDQLDALVKPALDKIDGNAG